MECDHEKRDEPTQINKRNSLRRFSNWFFSYSSPVPNDVALFIIDIISFERCCVYTAKFYYRRFSKRIHKDSFILDELTLVLRRVVTPNRPHNRIPRPLFPISRSFLCLEYKPFAMGFPRSIELSKVRPFYMNNRNANPLTSPKRQLSSGAVQSSPPIWTYKGVLASFLCIIISHVGSPLPK